MLRLFTLVALLHFYIGLRVAPDLPWGAAGFAVAILYLIASSTLIPLAMLSRRMSAARAERMAWIPWTGFIAMGAFSSLFVLTALRDLALLAGGTADLLLIPIYAELERFRTLSAAGIPVTAGALTVLGFINARRRAAVRDVDVPIAGLPAALEGFTIVQISDIHVGATIRHDYVSAIVDAVNALEADLVAVTGDIVDGSVAQLAPHTAPLARLAARHGAFFITGNHEYYSGVHAWTAEMRRLGLQVLMNEHRVVDHAGACVVVAGITDYSAEHFEAPHKSDPAAALANAPARAAFTLLLAHQPRSVFAARGLKIDLQLSGHTHGGQFLPWRWFVRFQQPFTAGLHRFEHLWIYVSRGTGYWGPPTRFGAPSEITRLRLRAAT